MPHLLVQSAAPVDTILIACRCCRTRQRCWCRGRWRYEITERIDPQGKVVSPLEEADSDAVIAGIRDAGLDTVAVSCLFSFLNDVHRRRVGERLWQALPGVGVDLSCEVLPEIREFRRPGRRRDDKSKMPRNANPAANLNRGRAHADR